MSLAYQAHKQKRKPSLKRSVLVIIYLFLQESMLELKVKFLTLYLGDSENTLLSPAAHSPCACIPTQILQTWKAILDSRSLGFWVFVLYLLDINCQLCFYILEGCMQF